MLDKIRELYGDPTTKSNILVRKIGENPFVFSWTNDSLTQQSCPKSEIRSLFSKLVEGEDAAYKSKFGTPSSQLKTLLGSDILVKSVSMSFLKVNWIQGHRFSQNGNQKFEGWPHKFILNLTNL